MISVRGFHNLWMEGKELKNCSYHAARVEVGAWGLQVYWNIVDVYV